MPTDPRIAVLSALSSPGWHPVPEAHGMPWDEAELLLAAYDASRAAASAAVPSAPADRAAILREALSRLRQVPFTNVLTELQSMVDCHACEAGIEHDVHCPTPETHNWGCGCPTDQLPLHAESGIDTPGCDCGHQGMGPKWHLKACAWLATMTVPHPDDVAGEAQQPAPLRAELKPGKLLGDVPDEPLPQTERLVGGRRLTRDEAQQPTSLAETIAAKRQEPAFVQLAEAWSTSGGLIDDGPPAPLRRAWDDCPGFPEKCPNLRPVDPDPPTHLGGIRCGCADKEPTQ